MIVSVPVELNKDHMVVLEHAQATFNTTLRSLLGATGWDEERAMRVLNLMLREGMVWVDDQGAGGERSYWFPSLADLATESL